MSLFGYVPNMPDPKTYGEQQVAGLEGALNRPLNAVQGALAYNEPVLEGARKGLFGEEQYDGLSMFSPETQGKYPRATAAGAVLSDLLLDPWNAVGGGLVKQGSREVAEEVAKVGGRNTMQGIVPSSFSNFIEGYYGMSKQQWDELPQDVKDKYTRMSEMTKGRMSPEETAAATGKVKGLMKFFWEGGWDATRNIMSPQSRALYKQTGIPESTIRLVEKHIKDATTDSGLDTRSSAFKKAVAQAQYQMLLMARMGEPSLLNDSLKRIQDVSFTGKFLPFDKQTYSEVVDNSGSAVYSGTKRKVAVDQTVNDRALDYISKAWRLPVGDPNVSMWVKRPYGAGGDHVTDAARKTSAVSAARTVFKELGDKVNSETLYNELVKRKTSRKGPNKGETTEFGKKYRVLNPSLEDAKENGVWLMSSGRSVSYTEGGVNQLVHIDNKGRATVWISDEQNFLENVPVVGQTMEGVSIGGKKRGGDLPMRQLTISEPIHLDITTNKANKAITNVSPKLAPEATRLSIDDFDDLLNLRPSQGLVEAESKKQLGQTIVGANVLGYGPEDE